MPPENRIILLSADINPDEQKIQKLDNCLKEIRNWDFVTERLVSSGMGPLFYVKIPRLKNADLIPARSVQRLKDAYYYTLSRSVMMYKVLNKVVTLLTGNDIEVMVLKGAFLVDALYGDVALRMFSDIDLLVREQDADRAFGLLQQAGFQSDPGDSMLTFLRDKAKHEHLPQLVYKGIPVELHTMLHKAEDEYEFSPDEMWAHAQQVTLQGVEVKVPDWPDTLIHTSIHLNKHFRDGQIQMSGFNDIVNILEVHRDTLDWVEVIKRSMQYKCENTVFKYIMLAHSTYRAYLPRYIVAEYVFYFSKEDTTLFRKYLTGFRGEHFSVESGLKRIQNMDSLRDKIKYVFWMMFPSKKYMIRSYNIKNPHLFWLYYPYRYWLGLKGIVRTIRK